MQSSSTAVVKRLFVQQFCSTPDEVTRFLDPQIPLPSKERQRAVAAVARWMLARIDRHIAEWFNLQAESGEASPDAILARHALQLGNFNQTVLVKLIAALQTAVGNELLLRGTGENEVLDDLRAFLTAQLTRPYSEPKAEPSQKTAAS